jgi:TatD DNase family protein
VELFDTHCHIQSAGSSAGERSTRELWAKAGDTSVDDIVARAHDKGVTRMICVGCDFKDSELAIECVKNRENMWASIGIHPHEAKITLDNGLLEPFAALATRPKVVAVGETGLDYFYNHSPREAQLEVLKFQMQLALDNDLPMIFHVREAFSDFWPVFDEFSTKTRPIRGVLHSFTDTQVNLEKAVSRGLYIGVNGIVTFAKVPKQQEMYRSIPLKNLVLETDAPFLTPVPYRGSICEPYHVETTANFLSDIRGEQLEELAQATTSNAQQLFGV